jgi:hypothetical protein
MNDTSYQLAAIGIIVTPETRWQRLEDSNSPVSPLCKGEVAWFYWREDGRFTGERTIQVETLGGVGVGAKASPIQRG